MELAGLIAQTTRFHGQFVWDQSKPDGQPRRAIAGSRAADRLGWVPTVVLAEGIRRTVAWYLSQ
jgi:GDP-L-fucose synthase